MNLDALAADTLDESPRGPANAGYRPPPGREVAMLVPVDDGLLLRKQRQFLEEVERKIAEVNREILHERIPELDRDSFVSLAQQVARLRASYLEAALAAKEETDPIRVVNELRLRREAYDEARDAFEALQRAIQRGYVDIGVMALP